MNEPTTTMTEGTKISRRYGDPIERTRANLLSGEYFKLCVISSMGAACMRPPPPLGRDQWAHYVQTIGRMAERSPAFAQLAAALLPVNLYSTAPEVIARANQMAVTALDAGFDDVIGRTGPEAGRPSSYQRDYTPAERVELACWLAEATAPMMDCVPTVGWCVEAIIKADHLYIPPHWFPKLRWSEEVAA